MEKEANQFSVPFLGTRINESSVELTKQTENPKDPMDPQPADQAPELVVPYQLWEDAKKLEGKQKPEAMERLILDALEKNTSPPLQDRALEAIVKRTAGNVQEPTSSMKTERPATNPDPKSEDDLQKLVKENLRKVLEEYVSQ